MSAASRHGASRSPIRIVRRHLRRAARAESARSQIRPSPSAASIAQHAGLVGESRQRLARAEPGVQRRRRHRSAGGFARHDAGRRRRPASTWPTCSSGFAVKNAAQQVAGRLVGRRRRAPRRGRVARIEARRSTSRAAADERALRARREMADRRHRQNGEKQTARRQGSDSEARSRKPVNARWRRSLSGCVIDLAMSRHATAHTSSVAAFARAIVAPSSPSF